MVRHGLKQVLLESGEVDLVDELSEGREVVRRLRESVYDVVVLDTSLAGRYGTELLAEIEMVSPGLPVLLLSCSREDHTDIRLREAGAHGRLTKAEAPRHLVPAVRTLISGGTYFETPQTAKHRSA